MVPADSDDRLARAAEALANELEAGLTGFSVGVSRSRVAYDPVDLYRAGQEALLAANVGEAEGARVLAFENTGAYRLLLPAMSEDPAELERFYSETVEPLVAYDEQYETELVGTVETYLENDGNVGGDRPAALHPPPHDPLPAGAGARALRARRHLDRGPREARARAEGDAGARIASPVGPARRAGHRGGSACRRPIGSD